MTIGVSLVVMTISAPAESAVPQREARWTYEGAGLGCALSPDGKFIAASQRDLVFVLDAANGKPVCPPLKHEKTVYSFAFSADQQQLVTSGGDGIVFWDIRTGKVGSRIDREPLFGNPFSSDGRRVLALNFSKKTVDVIDVLMRKAVLELFHDDQVHFARFSRDGHRIVTGGINGVFVWNADTGARLSGPIAREYSWIGQAALTPDGSKVVTQEDERKLTVCDAISGKMIWQSDATSGDLHATAFGPSDAQFAVAKGNYVQVWDLQTGKALTNKLGFTNMQIVDNKVIVPLVHDVAYSPDGKQLLAVGEGGVAIVWDIATGKQVAAAHGYDVYTQGAFSPDGKTFVVSGGSQNPDRFGTSLWALP